MASQEETAYMNQLELEIAQAKSERNQFAQAQSAMFQNDEQDNLIRWQLDLKEDLDRLYHLLKGETIGEDKEGNIAYIPADDPDLKPFNEFGVQMIMNIMSFYLNRNTILSNYDDSTIKWKVYDFGVDIADLIFNRYEEMMLTIVKKDKETALEFEERVKEHIQKKIKLYPIIVRELVDTVHSAYLRAYHGGERESLRTARTVTQSEPLGMNRMGMNPKAFSSQPEFKLLHPSTWRK